MYQTLSGGLVPPAPCTGGRKIPVVSKEHFTGSLTIGDAHGEGRTLEVESHLEMQVALILHGRRDVVDIATQAPFDWVDQDGEVHTHFFDFKVYHRDGARTAVMVKPQHRLSSERMVREARRIASQVTGDFAERVTVFTEASIDPVELHNAEMFHAYRRPDPETDAAARRAIRGLEGSVTLGTIVAEMNMGPRGFQALVRLVAQGRLTPARAERITRETLVSRSKF